MHAYTPGNMGGWEGMCVCVSRGESWEIGVIFCWCQLARGLQINVCVCVRAHTHMCLVQTKAPSQNTHKQISLSAEKQRVKRECRFHREKGGGEG